VYRKRFPENSIYWASKDGRNNKSIPKGGSSKKWFRES
jgi:hypothetical protein